VCAQIVRAVKMPNGKIDLSEMSTDAICILRGTARREIARYERDRVLANTEPEKLAYWRDLMRRIRREQKRRIVQLPLF
jgi:hypothetical protein